MKKITRLCAAAMLAVMLMPHAFALEYTFDSPDAGEFGTATSDATIYADQVGGNVDRSKGTALIPPGFGTPTSYLPGSGERLTPNLAGSAVSVSPVVSASAPAIVSSVVAAPAAVSAVTYPTTAYTGVSSGLYYSGGHLATLQIPSLGVNVKVYEGTDSTQLSKGAGHFSDTSIWDGNVCLAGHNRGVNCWFGDIHTLASGDTIKLTTRLGVRTYAVTSVSKISETDSSMLAATADNRITLITCVRNQPAYRWCVQAVEV